MADSERAEMSASEIARAIADAELMKDSGFKLRSSFARALLAQTAALAARDKRIEALEEDIRILREGTLEELKAWIAALQPTPTEEADDATRISKDSGRAVIEGNSIVIRVAIAALPEIVEGAWASSAMDLRLKVTNSKIFAKELVSALNDEAEDGTTAIHKMFDAAIWEASEQGAEGVEEHEEQDRG